MNVSIIRTAKILCIVAHSNFFILFDCYCQIGQFPLFESNLSNVLSTHRKFIEINDSLDTLPLYSLGCTISPQSSGISQLTPYTINAYIIPHKDIEIETSITSISSKLYNEITPSIICMWKSPIEQTDILFGLSSTYMNIGKEQYFIKGPYFLTGGITHISPWLSSKILCIQSLEPHDNILYHPSMSQYSIGICSDISDNFYLESDILILQAITGLRISAVMALTPDIVLRTTYSVPLQSLEFGINILNAPSLMVNGIIRTQSLFGNSYSINIESADIF